MPDPLDNLPDEVAAAAFRRLVRHLRHRHDAQNIDLMGLAGFCRNCLADWIRDAGFEGDKAAAREAIHGMPMRRVEGAFPDRGDCPNRSRGWKRAWRATRGPDPDPSTSG
jgi:uncharacterized protein